jgi:hypothetical protein
VHRDNSNPLGGIAWPHTRIDIEHSIQAVSIQAVLNNVNEIIFAGMEASEQLEEYHTHSI